MYFCKIWPTLLFHPKREEKGRVIEKGWKSKEEGREEGGGKDHKGGGVKGKERDGWVVKKREEGRASREEEGRD